MQLITSTGLAIAWVNRLLAATRDARAALRVDRPVRVEVVDVAPVGMPGPGEAQTRRTRPGGQAARNGCSAIGRPVSDAACQIGS